MILVGAPWGHRHTQLNARRPWVVYRESTADSGMSGAAIAVSARGYWQRGKPSRAIGARCEVRLNEPTSPTGSFALPTKQP